MGLALEVGIISDLEENDPEGAEYFAEGLRAANRLLENAGLPTHTERPVNDVWSGEMYGYSGLHYLRRIAAHVDAGLDIPEPGNDSNIDDPVHEQYFDDFIGKKPGLMARLFKSPQQFRRQFDHLIVHSDAEGFYLPVDFEQVLIDNEQSVPGGMLGSSHRLLAELDSLAKVLQIPDDLTSQSDALWDAADSQGSGDATWQQYGIESFSCVMLREGCRKSIDYGAALVFC